MLNSMNAGSEFANRFVRAIRRRLYPNSPLHPKQLAASTGYGYHAVMSWMRGEGRVPAEAVDDLAKFFKSVGDRWFLTEIFGEPSEAEVAQLEAELHRMRARLDEMQAAIRGQQNAPQNHDGGGVVGVAVLPAASGDLAAARGEMHVRLGSEPTARPRVAAAAPAARTIR